METLDSFAITIQYNRYITIQCFQYPEIFSDSISKLIPKYIWTNKNILGGLVIFDENLRL